MRREKSIREEKTREKVYNSTSLFRGLENWQVKIIEDRHLVFVHSLESFLVQYWYYYSVHSPIKVVRSDKYFFIPKLTKGTKFGLWIWRCLSNTETFLSKFGFNRNTGHWIENQKKLQERNSLKQCWDAAISCKRPNSVPALSLHKKDDFICLIQFWNNYSEVYVRYFSN